MIAGIQIYEALHLLFANDLRLADKTHYADKTRYSLKPTGRIYPFAVRENQDNTVPYVIYQTISNQVAPITGAWIETNTEKWQTVIAINDDESVVTVNDMTGPELKKFLTDNEVDFKSSAKVNELKDLVEDLIKSKNEG